jgi:WD40 repeat protein
MKNRRFLCMLTLLCAFPIFSANTLAQDTTTWNLPEGAKARLGKGRISKIAYSPDGMGLAVASSIGIWVYDVETGETLDLLTEDTGQILSVSFSPDGKMLASGSDDRTVGLWDVETGVHLRTFEGHTRSRVYSVSFSPDGKMLASGGEGGAVGSSSHA